MANDPTKHSLDEHFRRAFEELPNAPSASGWDVPSPRVWEGIDQTVNLEAGPSVKGTALGTKLLTAAAVVATVTAALFYFWPKQKAPMPSAPPTEAATVNMPMELPKAAQQPTDDKVQRTIIVHSPSTPPAVSVLKDKAAVPTQPPHVDTANALPLQGGNSARLPGSAPDAVPNTTERRRLEDLRNGRWRQPLEPLPSKRQQLGHPNMTH